MTVRAEGGAVAAHTMRDVHMHLAARAPVTWPHSVGVVPPRAGAFQDRAERAQLRAAVSGGGTAVLSGMGGVGKTQLAADFAEELWAEGVDLLVWVSALSRTALVSGLAQAGAEVCGADAADPEQASRAFLAWLRKGPRRWLVVLDDVADPADVSGLWPPAVAHGVTVVTTRRRDAALASGGRRLVHVGTFTSQVATAYLGAVLGEAGRTEPAADLAGLAEDLGFLPLALSQAAMYVVDTGVPVARYRDRLARQVRTLAEVSPEALPDDQPHSMAAAWELSVERADGLSPRGLARPMLELASFLAPNGIPVTVLTSGPAREYLAAHGNAPVTPDDAAGALRALRLFRLLTSLDQAAEEAEGGGLARVHQVVQRATRDTLSPERYAGAARAAADALVAAWPKIERDTALAQSLRACAAALAACTEEGAGDPACLYTPGIHPLLVRAGRSLGDSGQVAAAAAHFQRIVTATGTHLGPEALDTLTIRAHVAHWQGETGNTAAAIAAFTALLADRLRILGPDHPHTLDSRSHLAHWQGETGDAAAAVAAFTALLDDQLRVLGPDHPDTLSARSHLAHWQGETGDAAAAAAAFTALLDDRLRVLGPDHPDTLSARSHVARWQGETGSAAAPAAYAALLDDQLRVLGPDHPHTLTTRAQLAHWQGQTGTDAATAAAAFTGVLADRLRVLGPDHPDTLTTRAHLAHWQGEAGDPAAAVAAFTALLADRTRVLGPDHPHTLDTRAHLAHWQGEAGDPAAAVAAFTALLDDRLRVLGPDHPDTAGTRTHLASWQAETGEAGA